MEQRFTSLRPRVDLPKFQAILAPSQRQADDGKPHGWYRITDLSQAEAEVLLYDDIGAWGITAGDFINELRDIKASTIVLRINSGGGNVFDGLAIYNALVRHPATVNVFIDGIAASAASFIAMAGDTLMMMPHSQMMIHDAEGGAIGPADVMRQMADILDKQSDNIASIYAEKAGGTTAEWRTRMRDELWLGPEEAVEIGLADGIEGEEEEDVEARQAPHIGASIDALAQVPPVPEPEPKPPDFLKVFNKIADREDAEQYAIPS